MTPIVDRLRIKSDMIHVGERIAWGSDSALMDEAATTIVKANYIIERLLLRVQVGDNAAIEARVFLDALNGHDVGARNDQRTTA